MAWAPTDVNIGFIVAGCGPPWCMASDTATPVGQPLKIILPAESWSSFTRRFTTTRSLASSSDA